MKVAIVQEHVDVRRGGAETSTVEMARHLAALGLDVTLAHGEARRHEDTQVRSTGWPTSSEVGDTNSGRSDVSRRDQAAQLKFHPIAVAGRSRVAKTIRFVAEADRFCRDEDFDIVHAVTPCFSCNVYQPRGGTYVETVNRSIARVGSPLGRLIKRIGRRFNRRQRFLLLAERALLADRKPPFVAAVSDYVRRQVETAFPLCPTERLRVVFNGVETEPLPDEEAQRRRLEVRRELAVSDATALILFVAHNFKLKGLGELIRAMSPSSKSNQSPTLEKVGHPTSEPGAQATGQASAEGVLPDDWIIAVVGTDNPTPYRRLTRRLGLAARVRFLGGTDDIRSFYAAADVLAHPTWYDPCSRVVLEALSCGLPVVTTRFNGAAEVIEDHRHGVVIDSPRDQATLAAAISRCLRPQLRAACSADAPRMREQLSMARHARELKALYETALRPG